MPDFHFFHRASDAGSVDEKFVGRDRIIAILKNWLTTAPGSDGNDFTGAYLVTGYRGMGKTSFVGKVIDELGKQQKVRWQLFPNRRRNNKLWAALICMLPLLIALPLIVVWSYFRETLDLSRLFLGACFILSLIRFIVYLLLQISSGLYYVPITVCSVFIILLPLTSVCDEVLLLYAVSFLPDICCMLFQKAPEIRKNARSIIQIKVNIGNEISNSRDVLSLLTYSIRDRLKEHIRTEYLLSPTNIALQMLKYLVISFCMIGMFYYGLEFMSYGTDAFYSGADVSLFKSVLNYINEVGSGLIANHRILASCLGLCMSWGVAFLLWTVFAKTASGLMSNWQNSIYCLPDGVMKEVDSLCYRIDSAVSEDNSPYGDLSFASNISVVLRRKKTRQYKAATVREIEHELIELIEKINKNRLLNCRFIIVLDELDKLCIKEQSQKDVENHNLPEFTNDDNGLADEISSNEKRHKILAFLSQLKYFISTAQVKFVFIAGQELYDAYKADVSDREFSISSIFSGVINVNSFFSCDSQIRDVTRMTETYVCRHLFGSMPRPGKGEKRERDIYRLSEYGKAISIINEQGNDSVVQNEKNMVVCMLKHFVTYLTFVSNGAPKKLTARFERYVISADKFKTEYSSADDNIIVSLPGYCPETEYYLAFGYHDQQKIGFVNYIASPIFENIISPASDYGDKFLVSSSFLIAHIYKHHKSGFSWRNLEYLPELIDNNRTPELREFIGSIIGYLSRIHLTDITSGIYMYKFPMKLAEEIAIFTKKSDELSAVFNFSLDYFSSVKKYYYKLIDFYSRDEKHNSIVSSIHHNLGDIHMANDEFSEAIMQYRFAASIIERELTLGDIPDAKCKNQLKNNPDKAGDLASYIIRYIRIMLKLGLAYEKRNTIDSAHMTYTKICSKLVSYRDIDEKRLGLDYCYESTAGTADSNWHRTRILLTPLKENGNSESLPSVKCYPRIGEKTASNCLRFWIYGDEIVNNLSDYLTLEKHALITKLSVFEDLRIAYLPVLAKLLALEKYNICGITRDNLKVAESEFQNLYIVTNSRDKFLLSVDFYRKLGDIMYYKNTAYHTEDDSNLIYALDCWGYDLHEAIFNYCYRHGKSKIMFENYLSHFKQQVNFADVNDNDTVDDTIDALLCVKPKEPFVAGVKEIISEIPEEMKKRIVICAECHRRRTAIVNTPCYACKYYKRSLQYLRRNLIKDSLEIDSQSDSYLFLYALENGGLKSYRFNELIQTALTLEAMGNIVLSCSKVEKPETDSAGTNSSGLKATDSIEPGFVNKMFALYNNTGELDELCSKRMSNLEKSLLYFWGAMKYYSKAQSHKESMQSLVKIFNILSSYNATRDKLNKDKLNKDELNKNKLNKDEMNPDSSNCLSFEDSLPLMATAVMDIIRNIAQMRMCDNVREAEKLKHILAMKDEDKVALELLSIMPEVEELLLSFYEIKISQLSGCKLTALLDNLYLNTSLTYLRADSLVYNRVISLMFKARMNEKKLSTLGLNFKKVEFVKDSNGAVQFPDKDTMIFLVYDSFFCLLSINDVILSNPKTTLFSSSFCYGIYKRLYYWVKWEKFLINELPGAQDDMKKQHNKLLEGHQKLMLTEDYMLEMADKCIDDVESMHTEGIEYQHFMRNMYLLDDDLQNNTCQFYFALERMKRNSGFFKRSELQENEDGKEEGIEKGKEKNEDTNIDYSIYSGVY